jgi:adenylate kinase family enzyme
LTVSPAPGHAGAMRRIVILGNAGSGKSTLARRLGERLGLPVVHLDVLFWEPGWTEPDNEAFRARVRASIAGDAWISEGNYVGRTFDLRLPRADQVIWLDTPRLTCVRRVVVRSALARPRGDLAEGCKEGLIGTDFLPFLAYTWNYDRKYRARIEAAHQAVAPDIPVVHLRGRRQIDAFVASLS